MFPVPSTSIVPMSINEFNNWYLYYIMSILKFIILNVIYLP